MAIPLRVQIDGFKSIRHADLSLGPTSIDVLIGANGAGKSNFLGIFRMLHRIGNGDLQYFVQQTGGADQVLHFGRKVTQELRIRVDLNVLDHVSYEARLRPAGSELTFYEESVSYGTFRDLQKDLPSVLEEHGHRESKLTDWRGGPQAGLASSILEALKSFRVYHFQDTSDSAGVRLPCDLNDNFYLAPDAANLAAILYRFNQNHVLYYERIVKSIRLIAPFFNDFFLEPQKLNPDRIELRWREKGSDVTFGANALPDGLLRFICLTTLLMQPEPPYTTIIDEPETGLHPYALNLLASMVRSASTKRQIIVATQSAALVDEFTPEDIIVVEREDRQSVFRRKTTHELADWLEDYSLGELWEKNVLGGRPK